MSQPAGTRNRRIFVFGVVVAVAMAIFTTHKLHKMARIRGFIGDPPVEQQVVSGKTQERGRRTTFCFLSWVTEAPERRTDHRVQADCAYWEQVHIGDRIELVRLDDDDDDVYLRHGEIYASDGNFGFDFALLAIELGAAVYCMRRLSHDAAI